jgi:hypothetical protein
LSNRVELPFLQRPWVTPPGGKLLSSIGVSMPNEMNVELTFHYLDDLFDFLA